MLQRLQSLDSALARFLILRACLGACRVNFLFRSLDYTHGEQLALRTSELVQTAKSEILGTPLDDLQFALACLRSHKGGLGLQDPRFTHAPVFLAAVFNYASSADNDHLLAIDPNLLRGSVHPQGDARREGFH